MRREATGGPGEQHPGRGQVQRPWGGSVARVRVVAAGKPGRKRIVRGQGTTEVLGGFMGLGWPRSLWEEGSLVWLTCA